MKENTVKQANITLQQMEVAIPKIERRIADIDGFDVNSVHERYDPRIEGLSNKLDDLLVSIFGNDTVEYKRYHWSVTELDTAPHYMDREISLDQVRDGLKHGLANAKVQLTNIKEGFVESLQDSGRSPTSIALKAYEGLELHAAIERASGQLFRDGHYSNAVEDAVKALNALVKTYSGIDDKDGTSLMEKVFNPNTPVLKFNELKDDSDRDEQKGFMFMFSGAVIGLRNPRAHKIIKDDPKAALEFISFVSMLATLLDKTKKC